MSDVMPKEIIAIATWAKKDGSSCGGKWLTDFSAVQSSYLFSKYVRADLVEAEMRETAMELLAAYGQAQDLMDQVAMLNAHVGDLHELLKDITDDPTDWEITKKYWLDNAPESANRHNAKLRNDILTELIDIFDTDGNYAASNVLSAMLTKEGKE